MKNFLRNMVFLGFAICLNGCGGFDIGDAIDFAKIVAEEFEKNREYSPAEIQVERNKIFEIEDIDGRRKAYKDLQKRVPYQNQRANKENGDYSCGVTALSTALHYLGKDVSPDELSKKADDMCRNREKKQCNREVAATRAEIAREKYGVTRNEYKCKDNKNLASIANKIDEFLGDGKAVMISSLSHLVRVVEIKTDNNGNPTHFIVDDPYGKQNMILRAKNGGYGGYGMNANDKFGTGGAKGKQNAWSIKEMQDNNIMINYCEVYE